MEERAIHVSVESQRLTWVRTQPSLNTSIGMNSDSPLRNKGKVRTKNPANPALPYGMRYGYMHTKKSNVKLVFFHKAIFLANTGFLFSKYFSQKAYIFHLHRSIPFSQHMLNTPFPQHMANNNSFSTSHTCLCFHSPNSTSC